MKKKKIYYSRKGKSIIIEGHEKKHTKFLATLPQPEKLIRDAHEIIKRLKESNTHIPGFDKNSCFFKKEKVEKMIQILNRLDYVKKRGPKTTHSKPCANN